MYEYITETQVDLEEEGWTGLYNLQGERLFKRPAEPELEIGFTNVKHSEQT